MVTPVEQRLPLPPVGKGRNSWRFLWPIAIGVAIGLVAGLFADLGNAESSAMGLYGIGLLVTVVAGSVNSFWQTRRLLRRLPRRTRKAPLIFLFRRDLTVPLLVALATSAFGCAIVTGACVTSNYLAWKFWG